MRGGRVTLSIQGWVQNTSQPQNVRLDVGLVKLEYFVAVPAHHYVAHHYVAQLLSIWAILALFYDMCMEKRT